MRQVIRSGLNQEITTLDVAMMAGETQVVDDMLEKKSLMLEVVSPAKTLRIPSEAWVSTA